MTTRTDTAPVAPLPHHHNPVTTWLIGALAADNWRWYGTLMRVVAALILLESVLRQR
jgi:hypothetical protein